MEYVNVAGEQDAQPRELALRDHHEDVYRLCMAGFGSQVVRSLADLSVAEHLSGGPLTAGEVARRCCGDPGLTYRLLRAAACLGFLTYDDATSTFADTPKLAVLREDSPLSMRHFALACGGPAFWLPSSRMTETVRSGHNFVVDALGEDLWGYFGAHPEEGQTFQRAITNLSVPAILDAVAAIDVAGAESVVDIGGARGVFAAELVARHPQLSAMVLDVPDAMAGVAIECRRRGLGDRLTGKAGDFFDEVPTADIFLLKFILHDWDDRSCVKILANIRRAMKPGARLFIVEMTIAPSPAHLPAALMDMVMMLTLTGQEREPVHYERLLNAAGLTLAGTTALHHPYVLLEARAGV
ncbi:methyltransferase [Mycobacterium sp. NPDC003449]